MDKVEIPHRGIVYGIVAAAIKTHRRTPRGLRKQYYQQAMAVELVRQGLMAPPEFYLEIYREEDWLGRLYLDHWVNECVVVEDKAVFHSLGSAEVAQVTTYLAATQAQVGVLLNFGRSQLEYKCILPPPSFLNWQEHIAKYLWRPDTLAISTDD